MRQMHRHSREGSLIAHREVKVDLTGSRPIFANSTELTRSIIVKIQAARSLNKDRMESDDKEEYVSSDTPSSTAEDMLEWLTTYSVVVIGGVKYRPLDIIVSRGHTFITAVIQQLHLIYLHADIDVQIAILWWTSVYRSSSVNSRTVEELEYISSLTADELLPLIGEIYNEPVDHASILWLAMTGIRAPLPPFLPTPDNRERYLYIKSLPYIIVWMIAVHLYLLYRDNERLMHPYQLVLNNTLYQTLEPIVIRAMIDGPSVSSQIGMIFPPSIRDQDKMEYLLTNIGDYISVTTRPSNTTNIEDYTDQEIIDAFGEPDVWISRRELVDYATRSL